MSSHDLVEVGGGEDSGHRRCGKPPGPWTVGGAGVCRNCLLYMAVTAGVDTCRAGLPPRTAGLGRVLGCVTEVYPVGGSNPDFGRDEQ